MTVHEFEINKGAAVKRLDPDIQFKVSDVGGPNESIEFLDPSQTPPTAAEIEAEVAVMQGEYPWENIREQRNEKLRASDWRMSNDTPMSEAEQVAWGEYREALRNIPQSFSTPKKFGWPKNPKWPSAPE